jgi:ABC-type transport system substrate-binding protein
MARWVCLGLLLAVFLGHAKSQEAGVVIRELMWPSWAPGFDPVLCDDEICRRLRHFLYPTLFGVDLTTGMVELADEGNNGLVTTPFSPGVAIQRLRLREDKLWSDGVPVTAYDVLFSAIIDARLTGGRRTETIRSLRVNGLFEIEIAYFYADCVTPEISNLVIVPAHVHDPQFRAEVEAFDFDGDIHERFMAFYRSYARYRRVDFYSKPPSVTSGVLQFGSYRPFFDVRYRTDSGSGGYIAVDPQSVRGTGIFSIIEGSTNLYLNAQPEEILNHRDDETLTFTFLSSLERLYVQWRTHLSDGRPHPVLGDAAVRRAIQHGVDVGRLMQQAVLGLGQPLPAYQPPGSWAYNNDLAPIAFEPDLARQMLYEAGWRDQGGDGVLDCVSCATASPGTRLSFTLYVTDSMPYVQVAAQELQRQLRSIGIEVNLQDGIEPGGGAYLLREDSLVSPDPGIVFSPDWLNGQPGVSNRGLYQNANVNQFLMQARSAEQCNTELRIQAYHEIDRLFQADPPGLWLFSVDRIVVSKGIQGITASSAYEPLANFLEWSVGP